MRVAPLGTWSFKTKRNGFWTHVYFVIFQGFHNALSFSNQFTKIFNVRMILQIISQQF